MLYCKMKGIVPFALGTMQCLTCVVKEYNLTDFELFGKFEQLVHDLPEYKNLDKKLEDQKIAGLYQNMDYYWVDSWRRSRLYRSDIVRCQIGIHHEMNADTDTEIVYNVYYSVSKDSIVKIDNLRK